jgi:dTDP-4-amino-4,6-dideoxygalactose transaminase
LFKSNLSLYKIFSTFKLAISFLAKKDSKYPTYLIKYENKVSVLNNKKYTLSFSSGTQAFESLIRSLNIANEKIGVCNIVFPSIFRLLTRYFRSGNLKILICNKDLVLDLEKNYEEIKNLDYLLLTFGYGYPYDRQLINKIFSINSKINLIYDLSHSQGYSEKNIEQNMQIHYFFSTQGSKAISTGEGGVVSTDDLSIYKKMIFNSHLNRSDIKTNLSEKENLAVKIGILSKSRMSPLGAISGANDIFYLKKKIKI